MSGMSWSEFKAIIDKQMEEKGISPDSTIWYIDISFPDQSHPSSEVSVVLDDDSGIAI